ncbi:MAG: hypothetical protein LBD82_08435 [Deltaproteobacteria bacterium]|jgi:hypothetical protein|nr:hypothetical protein [Deltaproteobacteria bacterium]
MDNEAKKTLRLFQCDFNRSIEENFAQVLTESEKVRLFFINEDQAFTDGQNIVVDPAIGAVFADVKALRRAEDFMRLPHLISADPWYALRMITRGQNIHECLHILYTNFPPDVISDARATTKARKKALALIWNIIEDAFIEAAGCSIFDNLELYLLFERLAILFSNTPIEGSADRAFEQESTGKPEPLPLTDYLNYMGTFLLYPMIKQAEPSQRIAEYVLQTKQMFLDGSVCGSPDERFGFSQRVFDIIEPLIPESETDIDDSRLIKMLYGTKTHSAAPNAITNIVRKGRSAAVTRRLFTDLDGNPLPDKDFNEQLLVIVDDYEGDKSAALKIILFKPVVVTWKGAQFDCHSIHKGIEIVETKPKPNLNLRKAYQNIYSKYRININSYTSRFTRLLKARIPMREEKKLFGAGISSRNLADTKKRYWYRNGEDFGVPDIAVLLLIDGSGSMGGVRRESAMISSVILHEVLKKQGITHAIVEHRAIFWEPKVEHNILIDFDGSDEEKLNILALEADEGTREGLSLFWAERYVTGKTTSEQRLIIVLSDGIPCHNIDEDNSYMPPVSIKDTANAALKIIKRGTDIIAVALDDDDSGSCYNDLSEIYPSVIACTELKRLTGQLLGIISRHSLLSG